MHLLIYYNMGSKSAIGIGNGICFKQVRDKGGGSYIDPLVRDSIVGLWKSDQNTNESPTRNIIKNTIKGKGGDLELLNFGYKLNSGYGKYEEDFTDWIIYPNIKVTDSVITTDGNFKSSWFIYKHSNESKVNEMNIKVSGIPKEGKILYFYIPDETANLPIEYTIPKDGIYHLPESKINNNRTSIGFTVESRYDWNNIRIEQIPSFEGALVTDGVDDLITSTKTVQEMLGESNEVTVVSMIHQIGLSSLTTINNIRSESVAHLVCRNICSSAGKTGIYGYSRQINTNNPPTLINNILGDKKDYTVEGNTALDPTDKFFVQGYKYRGSISEVSQIAYYWTFIANKVLTTDEINQIIAYFKLDKYVTPQVIYDVKRQGLTNDTPAADWYLKDFSGNGHDMQLYNYAKELNSGVGKYEENFTTWNKYQNVVVTKDKISVNSLYKNNWLVYKQSTTRIAPMKVKIIGIPANGRIEYRYMKSSSDTVPSSYNITEDGIHDLPESLALSGGSVGFMITPDLDWTHIEIIQIPDYEGALVSDGKDDYGQFVGDLGLKDYTIAVDRAYVEGLGAQVPIISSIGTTVNTPFLMEHMGVGKILAPHSFGTYTALSTLNTDRFISYQSTYKYNGDNLTKGTSTDTGSGLTIGRFGANNSQYAKLALWSLLLFPYSLSEFLLERQLKRYKLGTLYPDMVEFRPIVKSNSEYQVIDYYIDNLPAVVGKYYPIDSNLRIAVVTKGVVDEVSSLIINGVSFGTPNVVNNRFTFNGTLSSKSPQKIDITIDEYIRYEDIVQPYPAIINLKQDGKTITWGDKLKVGSDIVFVGSANLLPELYTVSETQYNGVTLYPNTIIKVEKSMVFDNARTYLKANEPSCILSPNRLRIPNSSYKILGYIPDLTGKGNHGRLNNFAYAGMSGANGYVEDFTKWSKNSSLDDIEITYDRIKVNKLTGSTVLYVTSNKFINKIKIVASGIPNGGKLTFTQYPDNAIENNKEFEIGGVTTTGSWGFSIKEGLNLDWSNLVIQQIGEHEGSICFDGTDDHITIPTLAHGAKQVLMKVNLQSYDRYLYDQRNSWSQYLAIVSAGKTIAYEYSNKGGKTYIDGILNEHIIDKDLLNITHNITATNANIGVQYAPNIGTSFARGNFAQMALFDFMLFPEISSEEEIQELNDIVGIENNIEVS